LKTYHEQPNVHFLYNVIVILQGEHINGKPVEIFYSTIDELNTFRLESFRAASVRSLEVDDKNFDGLNERIELNFELPIQNEQIFSVEAVAFVSYELQSHAKVHTEGLAYIQHSSGLPASEYFSRGDIVLSQNVPVRIDDEYIDKYPMQELMDEFQTKMNSTEGAAGMSNIIKHYTGLTARNFIMVDYHERYSSWKRCLSCPSSEGEGMSTSGPRTFKLSITLDVPNLQQIVYTPTLQQVLVELWIRYLALLTIAFFLMRRTFYFIFSNHLISSHVTIDKIS
jgi:hypothetical protein